MTAICKVIPIHTKNIEPIIDYVEDMHKTDVGYASHNSESDYMKAVFDYTENPLKTQFGIDDGHEELKTYLPTFTEQEIRKNKAKQFPMTSKQKKELYYQCSNHPEWHLAFLIIPLQTNHSKI